MKAVCLICMREGSKGVPNKNIRILHGKPLMAYTIEQALKSGLFEAVVISTDSEAIADLARSFGAETWFLRPAEMANDTVGKLPARRHALLEAEKHFDRAFDVVFDLDVTSPLRDVDDILKAYDQFIDEAADILITASPAQRSPYFNMIEITNGNVNVVKQLEKAVTCRQDAPLVYDMNASIYIWKREALLSGNTLFTEKTSVYVMPQERSIDIDTQVDWEIVEALMGKCLESKHD